MATFLKLKLIPGLFLALMLCVPAGASTSTPPKTALPGTINYLEGQVSIDNQTLDSNSIGTAVLGNGQALNTETGKAEVLLTPGVFVRIGDQSSLKMISPDLTNTEVGLENGQAIVEVDEIHPENNIQVAEAGATIRLMKTGLYAFDADNSQVRVFDGEAMVRADDQQAKLKSGHELNLSITMLKSRKFNKATYETDDLYRWSNLRSAYVAEANVNAAPTYMAGGWGPGWFGPGWIGTGWYWNPCFSCYTFIPMNGIFYSPFGWGFYSPVMVYRAPIYFGGHYYRNFGLNARAWGPGVHYNPSLGNGLRSGRGIVGPRGGFGRGSQGGFHGGSRGGFHGGRGGFHGGGFGGGHGR
ncbi:MAG: FecR domain-containing protein [Candidatus Acidiferrales bacterium]